jgi:hypothetical protein
MTLDFDDVDSSRLRVGARYSYALGENTQGYVGATWKRNSTARPR